MSYPATLEVKKSNKIRFFTMKIYYISSQNDPNMTQTKNHVGVSATLTTETTTFVIVAIS
jgi:hypothetical protein